MQGEYHLGSPRGLLSPTGKVHALDVALAGLAFTACGQRAWGSSWSEEATTLAIDCRTCLRIIRRARIERA